VIPLQASPMQSAIDEPHRVWYSRAIGERKPPVRTRASNRYFGFWYFASRTRQVASR
jgi:hypothetical protein